MFPLKTLVAAAALAAIFGPGLEGRSHVHPVTAAQLLPAEAALQQTVWVPNSISLPMPPSIEVAAEPRQQP
jgi:hypothetical protein